MGKTAVVTGYASGMGRATAALLVAEGWTVVGLDRALLGRVMQPEDIAAWVLRLTGDGVAFMTGETIVLSGGNVIR